MFKRNQRHRSKNFEVLKRLVDRLNIVFDTNELYHHSTDGEICELSYLYDGRREGFVISYMGIPVWEEPLDDFYDDSSAIVDFNNEEVLYEIACQKIILKYRWMWVILGESNLSQEVKDNLIGSI